VSRASIRHGRRKRPISLKVIWPTLGKTIGRLPPWGLSANEGRTRCVRLDDVDFGAGGGGESEVDMDRLAGLKAGGPVERDAVIEVASVADVALGEAFAREADDGAMAGFCWTAATNAEVRPPICRLECMQASVSRS
jgi:hypothetical protein